MAADDAGNLYIADQTNHRIRKVDTSGTITTVAGSGPFGGDLDGGFSGDGGPATRPGSTNPEGVAVDASGNLYIADTGNNRIRKSRAPRHHHDGCGRSMGSGLSGDGGPATFRPISTIPAGVAVDDAGNLYIADLGNNKVRQGG